MSTLPLLLSLSLLFLAPTPAVARAQELIVVVEGSDGSMLSDALLIMQEADVFFLPLVETGKALGLSIQEVDTRVYEVEFGQRKERIEFMSCNDPRLAHCPRYFLWQGRPYLRIDDAKNTLKWPLTMEPRRLALVVETHQTPRGTSRARGLREDEGNIDPERDFFGAPRLALGARHQTYESSSLSNGSSSFNAQLVSPFFNHDLLLLHRADYTEEMKPLRDETEVTLSREAGKTPLLGPLQIRRYELFDFNSPDLPYIVRSRRLSGFSVTSRKASSSGIFARQSIRGVALPLWRAELYQNDIYLAETIVGSNSVYEFTDIPLYFGQNQFTIVLTSPLGLKETRREIYQVGTQSLKPGEWGYSVHRGFDKISQRTIEDIDMSIGASSRIEVGIGRQRLDDMVYWAPRLSLFGNGWALDLKNIVKEKGGNAMVLSPRAQVDGTLLGLEYARFSDFDSQLINPGGIFLQTEELQVSQMTPLRIGESGMPLILQNRYTQRNYRSLDPGRELDARILTRSQNTTYSIQARKDLDREGIQDVTLDWIRSSIARRLEAQIQHDGENVRTIGGGWNEQISELSAAGTGFQYYPRNPDASFAFARYTRDFKSFEGDLRLQHGKNDTFLVISAVTTLGFSPRHGTYQADSMASPTAAMAVFDFFVDENGNLQKDPEEKPVVGLRLQDANTRKNYETGEDGRVEIPELSPYRLARFEVAIESIPNIFLTPVEKNFDVFPTPAQIISRQVAVVSRFDLRGSVKSDAWRKIIPVRLLKADGSVFLETVTGTDGAYAFNEIPAGTYQIEVHPDFIKENKLNGDLAHRQLPLHGEGGVSHLEPLLAPSL